MLGKIGYERGRTSQRIAWGRAFVGLCLPALLILSGACGHCNDADAGLPIRASWPAIAPLQGATVVAQRVNGPTPPARLPDSQEWIFQTSTDPDTIRQYYRTQLLPQGWSTDSGGSLVEFRACPKLALDVVAASQQEGVWNYRVTLRQVACNTYC